MKTGPSAAWTGVATLLIFMVSPALGAGAGESTGGNREGDWEGTVARVYRIQYLNTSDATMISQQICLDQPGERTCEYRISGSNWFTYWTDEETHKKIEAELGKYDVAPSSLNFRLTLLMADPESSTDPKLPAGERQALSDLKQFLPFKGYRLIDSGWIRSKGKADLRLGSDPGFRMSMRFDWNIASGKPEILVEKFELIKPGYSERFGDIINEYPSQQLLRTSFAMNAGETVVVGTSKLNGNEQALVVLLTAEE